MDIKSRFHNIDLTFRKQFRGATLLEVEQVENELGFKFPKTLREYYINYNGAQLGTNCCFAHDDSYIKIGDMNEINALEKGMDFIYMCKIGLTEFWPNYLIPFAYDEGAHEICFGITDQDYGAIYFHNSELTGEPQETQFLAKDFLSFLEALRPESDFE